MRGGRTSYPQVAAFDMLTCLLLIFVILFLAQTPPVKPTIHTAGVLGVTASWRDGSDDDVDLYVRDPTGVICFFANPNAGLMNLEHDDLGTAVSGTQVLTDGRKVVVRANGERIIVRGVTAGQYTVNVQMFHKNDQAPTPVIVTFWVLRGTDHVVAQRAVVLVKQGDEQTAFRVTVDAEGNVTGITHTQADLVGPALGGQGPTVAPQRSFP